MILRREQQSRIAVTYKYERTNKKIFGKTTRFINIKSRELILFVFTTKISISNTSIVVLVLSSSN